MVLGGRRSGELHTGPERLVSNLILFCGALIGFGVLFSDFRGEGVETCGLASSEWAQM